MSKELVRICPKCKSTNVKRDLSLKSYGKGSFFNQFKCNNCGHRGIVFPEVKKSDIKKLKK